MTHPAMSMPETPVRLPRLDHERFTLDNGLTVVVQEDRRAPMVAVNLWYGVGSRDEPAGRTGFAHLFEHLFFQKSENRAQDWITLMTDLGAIDLNGSTGRDGTNYHQTIHVGALDYVLWMEADRMGRLLPAITEASLRREISIVRNEKMERESGPLGLLRETEVAALYGPDHPYGHTVLGSNADLDAATMDVVADWYHGWYGPGNTVLSLVGDISVAEAREKTTRAFDSVPARQPVSRVRRAVPLAPRTERLSYQARIPVRGYRRTWLTAPYGDRDATLLQMATRILSGDDDTRLYGRIVGRDRLAMDISIDQSSDALCGELAIGAQTATDGSIDLVAAAAAEELDRFLQDGPDDAEVARARRSLMLGLCGGLQNVSDRAEALSMGTSMTGRADAALDPIRIVAEATAEDIIGAARRWLGRPSLEIDVVPVGEAGRAVAGRHVVTPPPPVAPIALPTFPAVEQRTLPNGLKLVYVRRAPEMTIGMNLVIDGGRAAEPAGQRGVADFGFGLLTRGTGQRDHDTIRQELHAIGGALTASVRNDDCLLGVTMLADSWRTGMDLLFDVARHPLHPAEAFRRMHDASVAARRTAPMRGEMLVTQELDRRAFGDGHPYIDRSTADSLARLTLEDIQAWHRVTIRPDRTTLYAVGDVDFVVFVDEVERLAGDWHAGEPATPRKVPPIAPVPGSHMLVVDDMQQMSITAMLPIDLPGDDDAALYFVTRILGAGPSSRLYRRLREEHGWTYSVNSSLVTTRAGRWLSFSFGVQADAGTAAIAEFIDILAAMREAEPVSDAEMTATRDEVLRSLPSIWAGNDAVLATIMEYGSSGRALEAIGRMPANVAAVTAGQVRAVARRCLDPDRLVLVAGGPAVIAATAASGAAAIA